MSEFTEARLSSVFEEMNPGDSGSRGCRQIERNGRAIAQLGMGSSLRLRLPKILFI